jgi:DNA-binding MarR family transcriptional regulator
MMLRMTSSLQEVGQAVKRLQARHHRALDARLATLGLSIVQWDALRNLAAHPDASQHDLAVLTFQSDQAAGTLVARLIERGFAERVAGPGRAVRHRLTPPGREVLERAGPLVDEVLQGTLGTLTPRELDTLAGLLDRLVSAGTTVVS